MTRVRVGTDKYCDKSEATLNRKKRSIISEKELNEMMLKAGLQPNVFYRLRSQALIAIFSKTGKRRGELAKLKRNYLTISEDNTQLLIDFTLEKKKRHFKLCSNCLTRDKPTRNSATALFCKKCGVNLSETIVSVNSLSVNSIKSLYLDDPLVIHITEYLNFLDSLKHKDIWLFPASPFINGMSCTPRCRAKGRQL